MKRHVVCLLAVAVAGALTAPVVGQESRPLRAARSDNNRFVLRIEPDLNAARAVLAGRPAPAGARCRATLLGRADGARWEVRWEKPLVNSVAPGQAFVRDDGKYVVTLDDFAVGGAQHALVVYGADGERLCAFGLRELLHGDDWRHVKAVRQSVRWLDRAKGAFVKDADEFVLTLRWGREVRVDLRQRRVVGGDAAAATNDAALPEPVRALLSPGAAARSERSAEPGAVAAEDWLPEDVAPPRPRDGSSVNYIEWLDARARRGGDLGAPHYEAAFAALRPFEGDMELMQRVEMGDPEALRDPAIRAWLEANAEAIAHFRAGAQKRLAGFGYQGDSGVAVIDAVIARSGKLRQLARTTVAYGRLLALEGRTDEALAVFADLAAAGAQKTRAGLLVEDLVGVAIVSLAHRALLAEVGGANADQIDYAALAQTLDRPALQSESFSGVIRAEQAYMAASVLEVPGVAGYFGDQMGEDTAVFMDACAAVTSLPYAEARTLVSELEALAKRMPTAPLLGTIWPSMHRAFLLHQKAEMQRQGIRLLVNLRAYHQVHGTYPDSLEPFADRDFVDDPLSGQPFVYRREGDGFVLYSLGAAATDLGGQHERRAETGNYRFWPPPPPDER